MRRLDGQPLLDPLTERELEILRLLSNGMTNAEIADRLFLTLGTVKWYNNHIFAKLGVKNRTQAIARAGEFGLLGEAPVVALPQPASSPATPRHLPIQTMPFIGREEEVTAIAALLDDPDCRLLTLVGHGGIGKTRLAIEVAERQSAAFPDGVYFINLAPLALPEDILPALANVLNLRVAQGEDLSIALTDYLERRRALLIMDNFDDLLDGVELVTSLLQIAPGVKVLVTSRERLNVQEETRFRVGGFPLPDPQATQDSLHNSAVQLFVQTAKRVHLDFNLSAGNARAVAQICRLVDGMPLAIVLAASWVEMLSPAEIAAEIARNLDFLESDLRSLPERHRSIRGVFETTWRLLADAQRAAFAQLSVFRGGFTRDAAQQVTGAGLQTLMALVNKSLLRRDPDGRFEIHELLRQYAAEQLALTDAIESACGAHSHYYLDLLARQGEALDTIDAEMENVRIAWHWAVEHDRFAWIESALASLYQFCVRRNRYWEAVKFFDAAIELATRNPSAVNPLTRLRLHECRGNARLFTGELEGAIVDLQYVRNAAHDAGDEVWERELLVRLGQLYRKTERLVEAQRYLGEVLKVSRSNGNFRTVADTLYHLGTVSWDEGDNKVSRIYHQEAVEISTTLGLTDIVAVQAHHGMGEALLKAGSPQDALDSFTRSLVLARQIGDVSYESENLQMIGWSVLGLFGIGDYARAKVNFTESLALSEAAHLEWHSICCLIGLGLAEGVTGNYEQGLTRIEHGRRMAEALHVDRFMAMGLDCLGELYLDLHRYAEAEALHRQAIQMMMRAESTYWLPRLQGNYAIARMRQGDFNVEDDLQSILEVALVRNQEAHAFRCFEALAELYVARGHAGSALRYADPLLRLAEAGDLRELQASACRWRGEAFLVSGDLDAAETALARALELALGVGRVRLIVDIYAALARLSRQRNDDAAAARHDAAARRVCADIIALHQDAGIRARVLSAYAL